NEIHLTDGMLKLLKEHDFAGYHFRGATYDCGSKDGFILANVAFALERADIRPSVEGVFRELLAVLGAAVVGRAAEMVPGEILFLQQ
ncbi:hypothetical protein ACC754_40510, partial [Rhizobium johnstonii]